MRPTFRRALCVLPAVVLLGAVAMAPVATAAPADNVIGTCTATYPLDVNPGLTLLSTVNHAFTSNGPTGVVVCTLSVDGVPVVDAGTFGVHGTTFGNCVTTNGSGQFTITLPTTTIIRSFTFSSALLTATLTGDDVVGATTAAPLPPTQICVTPVTHVQAVSVLVFSGS